MLASKNVGKDNPMFGKKHTLEAIEKMRLAHLGKKLKPFSEEHRRNISLAARGRYAGIKNYFWKGGIKHNNGYIKVHCPEHPFVDKNGYVYEHRLVLEKKLGRYLRPEERPHHINGIRADNRPENLELYGGNGRHMIAAHIDRNSKGQFCKKAAGRLLGSREWNELPGVK